MSPSVAPPAPRPPSVAPPAPRAAAGVAHDKPKPQQVARWEDEPPSGGWDNADTATDFPEPSDLPEPTPRMLPHVESASPPAAAAMSPPTQASPETSVPATPASPGTMRGPYPAPGVGSHQAALPAPLPAAGVPASPKAATASHAMAATAGLGSAMREEVWAIVRAAVEEAVAPIVARQRELEARLERAERDPDVGASRARAAQAAPQQGGGASAASRLASIGGAVGAPPAPAALGPALLPAVFKPADPGPRNLDLAPGAVPSRGGSTSAHPTGPRPSSPPQGYGVTVTTAPRVSIDLDSVGPVDIEGFDGGRRKRNVGRVVVVMMLLLIGGAITMMVLSYN